MTVVNWLSGQIHSTVNTTIISYMFQYMCTKNKFIFINKYDSTVDGYVKHMVAFNSWVHSLYEFFAVVSDVFSSFFFNCSLSADCDKKAFNIFNLAYEQLFDRLIRNNIGWAHSLYASTLEIKVNILFIDSLICQLFFLSNALHRYRYIFSKSIDL